MKIIGEVKLTTNRIALELNWPPSEPEVLEFNEWALDNEIFQYLELRNFYRSDMFGDTDHPAIQIRNNAPAEVRTLCMLRWI